MSLGFAVKRLVANPELRGKYQENVHRAKNDLNWEKEEDLLRDLVQRVLKP
jgi:hypothetical protein